MTIPSGAVQPSSVPTPEPSAPVEPQGAEVQQTTDPSSENFNWEGGLKRDELGRWVTKVATDQDVQRVLETIAAKDTVTVEDLRQLPEAKGFTDAQLQKLWEEVSGTGNQAPPPEPPKPTTPRNWKAFKGTDEVADLSKMTAEEFLQLQFEYTANGKAHRRAMDEVFRNASQGHYNAERMQTLQQERNRAYEQWKALEPKVEQYEAERQIWDNALAAAARNDIGPMQRLLQAYVDALGKAPEAPAPPSGPSPEAIQAGWNVYNTTVLPAAEKLAQEHGLGVKEIADGIMLMVELEPAEFLTQERFNQIVNVEIPMLIQQMKAEANPAPAGPDPRDAEIERLKAELAKQKGTKAQENNDKVTALHQRRATAPPPSPRMPANSSPDISGIQDGQSAREWLNNWKG